MTRSKRRSIECVTGSKFSERRTPVERSRNNASRDSYRVPISVAILLAALLTSGCGGGGGSDDDSDWEPGVFLPAATYRASCASPRSGINPATGQPYRDVKGKLVDENNFLRSYSNDTYLWYDEIIDRDPSRYNDPLVYFDLLKTTGITPSGRPRDRFHFSLV